MDSTRPKTEPLSRFYTNEFSRELSGQRSVTATGTLFTHVGKSNFYHGKSMDSRDEEVQLNRDLTGNVIMQCGQSNFFSKPSVASFNEYPPNILHNASPLEEEQRKGTIKFPQMKEFVHFHYEKTNVPQFEVEVDIKSGRDEHSMVSLFVTSNNNTWVVHRELADFLVLDRQIHRCLFNREFSQLQSLAVYANQQIKEDRVKSALQKYLNRFCSMTGSDTNCGTVLNFFEMDSRGNRLITDSTRSDINIPAIGAAKVVNRYDAQAPDELSLQDGDLISIIDMPPASESIWWRGKNSKLEVGFFPSDCVEVIGVRKSMITKEIKPQNNTAKFGKLMVVLRNFFSHRPSKQSLQAAGIIKGEVFGTDLGEYLDNCGLVIPDVLKYCADVVEQFGIVDGIYRLSGASTNVQSLREQFDRGITPAKDLDSSFSDVHAYSSLLKLYFRELPNPLLTYQLYLKFIGCAGLTDTQSKIDAMRETLKMLPPPHLHTSKFLFKHLYYVSRFGHQTGMTTRNLAIVWAPNLMRHRDEKGSLNGFALLKGVGQQAAVVDYLIENYPQLFTDQPTASPQGKRKMYYNAAKRLISIRNVKRASPSKCHIVIKDKTQIGKELRRSKSRSMHSFFEGAESLANLSVGLVSRLSGTSSAESVSDSVERYPEVKTDRRRRFLSEVTQLDPEYDDPSTYLQSTPDISTAERHSSVNKIRESRNSYDYVRPEYLGGLTRIPQTASTPRESAVSERSSNYFIPLSTDQNLDALSLEQDQTTAAQLTTNEQTNHVQQTSENHKTVETLTSTKPKPAPRSVKPKHEYVNVLWLNPNQERVKYCDKRRWSIGCSLGKSLTGEPIYDQPYDSVSEEQSKYLSGSVSSDSDYDNAIPELKHSLSIKDRISGLTSFSNPTSRDDAIIDLGRRSDTIDSETV